MKKLSIRLLCLFLLLAMVLPLAACAGPNAGGGETSGLSAEKDKLFSQQLASGTAGEVYKTDLAAQTLSALENLVEYTIVYSDLASDTVVALATDLALAIDAATGVPLDVITDRVAWGETVPEDTYEILLGVTNRAENIVNLKYNDYTIMKMGNRVVIAAGSDAALVTAVSEFEELMIDEATLSVKTPSIGYHFRDAYAVGTLQIAGTDLSKYTIVRTEDCAPSAEYLQKQLRLLTGIQVPIDTDRAEERTYEILLGNVERDETASLPVEGKYAMKQVGTKLLLSGRSANAGYFAMLDFLNTYVKPITTSEVVSLAVTAKEGDHLTRGLFALNLKDEFDSMADKKYDITMSVDTIYQRFLYAKAELPDEVTVVERIDIDDYPLSADRAYYVSPEGDDSNPGTYEKPFKNLQTALNHMAGKPGGVIWMRAGTHVLDGSVSIPRGCSGTFTSPLFIKAFPGEEGQVILTSNKKANTEGFYSVNPSDDEVAARLPMEAQDYVVYSSLEDLGWDESDIAVISKKDGPRTLYLGGQTYTLARFPNNTGDISDLLYFKYVYDAGSVSVRDGSDLYWGWVKRAAELGIPETTELGWKIRVINNRDGLCLPSARMSHVLNDADGGAQRFEGWRKEPENKAIEEKEALLGDAILNWVNTGDIWYYGSTFEGWEFGYYNIAASSSHPSEDGSLNLLGKLEEDGYYSLESMSPSPYGAKDSSNSAAGRNTFYLFNAIEALDQPGEWYYDKENGNLYVWPMEEHDFYMGTELVTSGDSSFTLLEMKNVDHIVLDGITFDGAGKYGLNIFGCSDIVVQNCKFTNTQYQNLWMESSVRCAVIYSDFSYSVNTGMIATAHRDSARTLTPTHIVIQNNVFHDPAPYMQCAISLGGCQAVASHNLFINTNIQGQEGFEIIVEYNLFEGGSKDITDGGMVYFGGISCRGIHVRYNLCHKFNATHNAFYNDTMGSGSYVYGNVVSTLGAHSNRCNAWYSSTGHNNICFGNIFLLRNAAQIADAGASDGDEDTEKNNKEAADSVNESDLFYYYYGDDYYPNRKDGYLNSLAGHWWLGLKTGEASSILDRYEREAWTDRFPEYVEWVKGTRVIVSAYTELTGQGVPDDKKYALRDFYGEEYLDGSVGKHGDPFPLTDKWFIYDGAALGDFITVPEYRYKDAEGKIQWMPEQKIVASKLQKTTGEGENAVTKEVIGYKLRYEDVAAMERIRRQPAYSLIKNNLILGGSTNADNVITHSGKDYFGMLDKTDEVNNYLSFTYSDIMADAKNYDYTISDENWEAIRNNTAYWNEQGATADEVDEFIDWLKTIDYTKAGLTYDYTAGE